MSEIDFKDVWEMYRIKFVTSGKTAWENFWAVRGISFVLERGEIVGIIGENGSGKSTVLKLITGMLKPDRGQVSVSGSVSGLLELGAGFQMELTGRENVFLQFELFGLSANQARERFQQIVDFAEIGKFMDAPVKCYSQGMFVRLAFAIIAHVEADIMLIDEALAVGDIFFQQKCHCFLAGRKPHCAMLMVSHDLNAVSTLCDRVLVLDRGKSVFLGDTCNAIEFYTHLLYSSLSQPQKKTTSPTSQNTLSPIAMEKCTGEYGLFLAAGTSDENGNIVIVRQAGEILHIEAEVELNRECPEPIVGFFFSDRFGKRVFGNCSNNSTPLIPGKLLFSFDIVWPDIAPGDYTITLGLGSGADVMAQQVYCWATNFLAITSIKDRGIVHGVFNIRMENFKMRSDKNGVC